MATDAHEIISGIRVGLTTWMPFFGHLLLKMEPVILPDFPHPAAVTPDRKLLLNEKFVLTTPAPRLSGVLIHEVLHLALLYWSRKPGHDVKVCGKDGIPVDLFNVAHDYVVNLIIREMVQGSRASYGAGKVEDPGTWGGALIDDQYKDWSGEQVYDHLLNQLSENESLQASITGDIGDVLPGTGPDGKTSSEQKEQEQFWQQSLLEAAQIHEMRTKGKGKLPAGLQKLIDDILYPRVPWVDVLSRWMGAHGRRADFSYRRPARRSESVGEILPSLHKSGVDDIVVLWDSSGSMNGREKDIAAEVIGICQDLDMRLRVIVIDAAIYSDQSEVECLEDINFGGGGGSSFQPAFERLDEECYDGVVLAFTDGFIDVPAEKPVHIREVLWVTWNGDVDPTAGRWGDLLVVDEEGFEKRSRG